MGGAPTALPLLNQQNVFTATNLSERVSKLLDSSIQSAVNESVSQTVTIHNKEFVNQPTASFIEKVLLYKSQLCLMTKIDLHPGISSLSSCRLVTVHRPASSAVLC